MRSRFVLAHVLAFAAFVAHFQVARAENAGDRICIAFNEIHFQVLTSDGKRLDAVRAAHSISGYQYRMDRGAFGLKKGMAWLHTYLRHMGPPMFGSTLPLYPVATPGQEHVVVPAFKVCKPKAEWKEITTHVSYLERVVPFVDDRGQNRLCALNRYSTLKGRAKSCEREFVDTSPAPTSSDPTAPIVMTCTLQESSEEIAHWERDDLEACRRNASNFPLERFPHLVEIAAGP